MNRSILISLLVQFEDCRFLQLSIAYNILSNSPKKRLAGLFDKCPHPPIWLALDRLVLAASLSLQYPVFEIALFQAAHHHVER